MFHLVLPSSFDRQQRGGRVSGGVCSCQFTCFMHLYTCTLAVVHLYRGEGGCLVVVVAANSPALCTQKNCGRGFGCSGTDRDWCSMGVFHIAIALNWMLEDRQRVGSGSTLPIST